MKYIILMISVLVTSACSIQSLTKEGAMVELREKDPAGCRYIGEVAAYLQGHEGHMDLFGAARMEREQRDVWVKNEAGKLGGDTVVKLFSKSSANIQFTIHSVYRCSA